MFIRPPNPSQRHLGDRILKVNHAGEHGAIAIYSGQICMARLTAPDLVTELQEFRSHEQKHRAIFWQELSRRGQRRCRSYGLCALGGWVLGLITGLLGRQAIAATTAAIEQVVLGHLSQQIQQLRGVDDAAVAAISAIIDEEQTHHDHAAAQLNAGQFWPTLLKPVVALSTESVIWVGMHV